MIKTIIYLIFYIIFFSLLFRNIFKRRKEWEKRKKNAQRKGTKRNYRRKIIVCDITLIFLCSFPLSLTIICPYIINAQKSKIKHTIQNIRMQEDDFLEIQKLSASANKSNSEKEQIEKLMEDLFYNSFTKDILTGNEDVLEITAANINFYNQPILANLYPPYLEISYSPDCLLQDAKDAETRAKANAMMDDPDCITVLTDAHTAISKFINCLQYPTINYETHYDIRMRIGIIFYNLYKYLDEITVYNPNYRNHFLLCAYQCFSISRGEGNPDHDHYLMQSYFYCGESGFNIGKQISDLEVRLDYYVAAQNNIRIYKNDCETNNKMGELYEIACKDYDDLEILISQTKETITEKSTSS